MKNKEKNGCDNLVEMFADMGADMLGVYECGKDGMITVEPIDSKTGTSWAMSLITSVDEAIESKYQKSFRSEQDYENFMKFVPKETDSGKGDKE
jgi:hypothetical protein